MISSMKKVIPVLATSLVAWFYGMAIVPLAYMYEAFPGQESIVTLIASLPGVFAMIGAFASTPLMRLMSKRTLVIVALFLCLGGGLLVRFTGNNSLLLSVVGACITGFPAGIVPSVNYAVLAEVAPENLRDKVCGWSDALCSIGLMASSFLAGIFSQDGDWVKAFSCFYLIIPVLAVALIAYPRSSGSAEVSAVEVQEEEASVLPKSVIGIVVVKFFAAFFYMAVSYNISELIITELNIGTSALVGTATTCALLVNSLASALVFLWLKFLKGGSTLVAEIIMGAAMLLIACFARSGPMCIVLWMLLAVGMGTHHSSFSTVSTMACKGKAVGLATSLFTGATFCGEFVGAYAPAVLAGLVYGGTTLPSQNILVSGVMCVIFGIIGFPFFRKASKLAFGKAETHSA